MVAAARNRYESGQGRLEDVLRAEAERARTLVDLAALHAEEDGARARLDALRGRSPGEAADTLDPPPITGWVDRETWRAAISPDHPRLQEGRARVERYQWAARAMRRSILPDLELKGVFQKREALFGIEPQHDMWSAMVGFAVPIFASANEVEQTSEMKAMANASEADLGATLLDLEAQVTSAYAEAEAARRTAALLADTVLATQSRAVEASWVSYSAGTTDLWRVLEATHAQYSEEVALVRARQDLARATARLVSLTGRGDLVGIALPEDERTKR
jgi:outer membrane protein TolC